LNEIYYFSKPVKSDKNYRIFKNRNPTLMKKVICLIVFLHIICRASAQDLTISFQPKVIGTLIDSIQAINLRTNQIVKLSGNESLLLVKTPTNLHSLQDNPEIGTIYPNPCFNDATFCFSTNISQQVELRLYNANGKLMNQKWQELTQGTHRFILRFPVMGIYFLSVEKSEGSVSYKVVYSGRKNQGSSLLYIGSEKLISYKPDLNPLKSATTLKTMVYSEGDVNQYSIFSGKNTTVISDIPTGSKTIFAEFVNCIDKDSKSYKVVKIGSQWWMAENLAYLPAVNPPVTGSPTAPFYYVYGYEGTNVATAKATANYTTYGVLYNWPAAKAACPTGWHLPGDDEWTALSDYLGGKDVSGGKMKETGITHWASPNEGATNESGFTSLPAGNRDKEGAFSSVVNIGFWWSSSEYYDNKNYVWSWWNANFYDNGYSYMILKEYGYSVRCVGD
jgi:uncharacterized protein (TIGR02145 family)